MAVYFANTEITGIKDLFPLSSKDITGLYFADTELFTVWDTYDGTLPATYSANGSMLADYHIYGASGGVGDRTENYFGVDLEMGAFVFSTGAKLESNTRVRTKNAFLLPPGQYTLSCKEVRTCGIYVYDTGMNFQPEESIRSWSAMPFTFSLRGNRYINVQFAGPGSGELSSIGDVSNVMLTTAPAEYVPYGYEVDMSVRSENLFDLSDTVPNYRYDDNGNWVNDNGVLSSGLMKIAAGSRYEYKFELVAGKFNGICRINFLDASGQWLSVNKTSFYDAVGATVTISGTAPAGTAFIRTSQYNGEQNISMTVVANTPIYIGDTTLGEDEYVDYGEQKVYRRTENLFDKAKAKIGSLTYNGEDLPSTTAIRSDYMAVSAGETYYVNTYDGFYFQYCAGYIGKRFATEIVLNTPPIPSRQAIIIPKNVDSIRIVFRKAKKQPYPEITDVNLINATVTEGSTAPEQYIPYLQPEYPPVPLPALPTVDGTNIVDYAGQSAAVPSRFYAKYRKEGFN